MKMIIKKEDADVLKLPFLEEIIDKCQDTKYDVPLEITIKEEAYLLGMNLLEDDSSAAGHGNEKSTLYIVLRNKLQEVSVNRLARAIYPVDYGNFNCYPPDEPGWSENVKMALSRQDLTDVSHVVVHRSVSGASGNNYEIVNVAPLTKSTK